MTPTLDAEAIARTAADLIAIPSLGGEEAAVVDHVAGWLTDRGVAVEQASVRAADLRDHSFHSAEVERDEVPVLVARVGRGGGPTLLLNAHVDVVPAADQHGWSRDPFTPAVIDGRLHGRGACDTKGGLAAAMHVMVVLAADPPAGQVLLTPVVGEEDGGVGTLATLVHGVTADAAVVIEPTGLDIARASAGALCFRVRVAGRTAHGSVRHTGVSAIEKGWLVHRALLDLEAERAAARRHDLYPAEVAFPLCMGRIEGGDYRCDEAGWLDIEGRLGTPPDEPVAAARAALQARVAEVAAGDPWLAEHPPTVEWIGAQWVGGHADADATIVRRAVAADPQADVVGMPYGCDLGLLDQVGGIPGVVYGPGLAADAHAPDESVAVADLARCARTLHRLTGGDVAGLSSRPPAPRR